ncbi:hybrid sensor histidine kinase/response regulator [Sabulicella rubraurantiaca]|uniref:hybrid sensor histidine kinase/response regulator n=1 Tax=Sabulicella rubraurantiaca TaxID=2811429 RepID=UPI001A9765D2|nr:ATP-binding protein [Sabulicella rubraurantiaca]
MRPDPKPPSRRPALLALLATGVLLAIMAFATQRLLERGDDLAEASAQALLERAGDFAATTVARELAAAQSRVDAVASLIAEGVVAPSDKLRMVRLLQAETLGYSFSIHQDGQPLDGSTPLPADAPVHVHHDIPGMSLFGPTRRPDGGWSLFLIREFPVPGEAPLLLVAEIPNLRLATALRPIQHPDPLRFHVEDASGTVLAAAAGQEHLIGTTISPRPAWLESGPLVRRTGADGSSELHHSTQRALPFGAIALTAILPEHVALGEWHALRSRIIVRVFAFGMMTAALGLLVASVFALRLRAQEAAIEARRKMQGAIAALQDGFALWDPEDRLVLWNPRLEELYAELRPGFRPGASYTELLRDIARRYPAYRTTGDLEERMLEHRRTGEPFDRKTPSGRWLRVAQSRLPDGSLVGIHTDVTAQKRIMEELAEARDDASRAMQAKSRILTHVSHELRTPLSSLLRLTAHLRRAAALPGEARRQVEMVDAAGRHLLSLANEVLDLAAMEAGRLSLNEEAVPAAEPFEAAASIIRPVAAARRVEVRLRLSGLPAGMRADATRLRQILLNLLGNAVKFTPEGSEVLLEVRREGGRLVADVSDQGPGVPEAERAALFADFGKLSPADVEGTGLGLSISARLAALMGGSIACLDGPDGRGATFRLDLPLVEAALPALVAEPRLRKLRILAVDDSPANLAVLRALLATTGFGLTCVTGGEAALEAVEAAAARGEAFDAVLMDVMMPGMDGMEATRRLRALPGPVGATPVIAVTASAFPEDIAAARSAGMERHIAKPVERQRLLALLAELAGTEPERNTGLGTLRPALEAELRSHADAVLAAQPGDPRLPERLHALAGAAAYLEMERVAGPARRTRRALVDGAPETASELAALREALRIEGLALSA